MEKMSKRDVSAVLEDTSFYAPQSKEDDHLYATESLARQKRSSDYDDAQKWSPGYVVGTSPQVDTVGFVKHAT